MLNAQQIYGPQPPSIAAQGDIALGCRLFHRDARAGAPLVSAESGAILTADIRIDNRAELHTALRIATSRSELSDAELLLKALDRWGAEAVEHVHGDFAFVYWDAPRHRLVLARDFLGQRPLHYCHGGGFFAFASMAKGLHALPEVPFAPNLETLANFVALMPEDGDETFFHGVHKVRAGHIVTVSRDGLRSECWWRPTAASLGVRHAEDYAEGLRHHFDRAVADRLAGSRDRVGSHLSAGLDSSSVTATAARLLGPEGGRVIAFTAVPREGYDGPAAPGTIIDEGAKAAELAAMYPNIEHVVMHNGASPVAGLDRNFLLYERPMLNLCNAAWVDQILDEVRARGLKVLLTGQAGNMSISYDGMTYLNQLMKGGRLLRLGSESLALYRAGTRLGTIAAQLFGPYVPRPLWSAISRLRGKSTQLSDYTAIAPDAVERFRLMDRAAERQLDTSYRPRADPLEMRLWVLRRVDMGSYNKGMLAGWGVDVRDPTADRRLVEYCLSVPTEQFLQQGTTRALVRNAFADRLPPSIVRERRKGYQGADWHEALAAAKPELCTELERIDGGPDAGGLLDIVRMKHLAENLPTSNWHKPEIVQKYRLALLRGVSAGHFARRASGSNR